MLLANFSFESMWIGIVPGEPAGGKPERGGNEIGARAGGVSPCYGGRGDGDSPDCGTGAPLELPAGSNKTLEPTKSYKNAGLFLLIKEVCGLCTLLVNS